MTAPPLHDTTTDRADAAATRAVLPVGAFEQHGPHLPLTTDTIIADAIAQRVARAIGAARLPALPVSCSHEHASFPGTVSITAATLDAVIGDLVASLRGQGMRGLVIVNGHGGNHALANIAQQINVAAPFVLVLPQRSHIERAFRDAGLTTTPHADMHAGEMETSVMLHVRPDAVRMDRAVDVVADDRTLLHLRGMEAYTPSGVIGRPTLATAEKGAAYLDRLLDAVADDLQRFVTLTTSSR
jgi:creatinine amidohydrolase